MNRFVAGFIGSPAMNFVEGIVMEEGTHVRLSLPGLRSEIAGRRPPGEGLTVGLRPEHLVPVSEPQRRKHNALPVSLVEQTGSMTYVVTETDPF